MLSQPTAFPDGKRARNYCRHASHKAHTHKYSRHSLQATAAPSVTPACLTHQTPSCRKSTPSPFLQVSLASCLYSRHTPHLTGFCPSHYASTLLFDLPRLVPLLYASTSLCPGLEQNPICRQRWALSAVPDRSVVNAQPCVVWCRFVSLHPCPAPPNLIILYRKACTDISCTCPTLCRLPAAGIPPCFHRPHAPRCLLSAQVLTSATHA